MKNSMKLILLIAATLAGTAWAAPPDAQPRLGINLAGPADWMTELPFVDVFRTSRPWISQKKGRRLGPGAGTGTRRIRLGQDGWSPAATPRRCSARSAAGIIPSGVYTVLYEGEGKTRLSARTPRSTTPSRAAC